MSFDEFTQQQLGLGIFSSDTDLPVPLQTNVGELPLDSAPPRLVDRSGSVCQTPVNNQICNSCAAQVRRLEMPNVKTRSSFDLVNCGHCGVVSLPGRWREAGQLEVSPAAAGVH